MLRVPFYALTFSPLCRKHLPAHLKLWQDHRICTEARHRRFNSNLSDQTQAGVPTSDGLTELPPIPALPPAVKGWPNPWIRKLDATQYLYPLYSHGWGLKFRQAGHLQVPCTHIGTLFVNKSFQSFKAAVEFITDIAKITKTEKHHPSVLSISNRGKSYRVSIATYTHSAVRPRWPQELDDSIPLEMPGITRRDLRFAILVEKLFVEYQRDGRGTAGPSEMCRQMDRPTWSRLGARYVRYSIGMEHDEEEGLPDIEQDEFELEFEPQLANNDGSTTNTPEFQDALQKLKLMTGKTGISTPST